MFVTFSIPIITGLFILLDIIIDKCKINGNYYIIHLIANTIVVYNTMQDMLLSYVYKHDIQSIIPYNNNNLDFTKNIIYSLHFYHIIWYFNKLRKDDWIHHIIMILIALPLVELLYPSPLIGHCLFFTTGLPGGIDYLLLIFVRNNIINKMTEKQINNIINLWIRCPGCISNATLSLSNLLLNYNILSIYEILAASIIIICVYWNGIYFMAQVTHDYILLKNI